MNPTTEPDTIEIQTCAHAGHEAVRVYCERQGDFRHKPWDMLEDAEKIPARLGARGVITENHTPEQSHEAWRAHRDATGWRFGERFNATLREHPDIVPWVKLSHVEQVKNRLFVDAVKSMHRALQAIPNQ